MTDTALDTDEGFEEADFVEIPPEEEVTTEQRARAMGWKPFDEYRGDPRRWTDAETFIRHGEEELPILRDQSRRMSEKLVRQDTEIASLRNTVAEQTTAIQDAMKLARRADETGYRRGLAELKAKQREAVETGDTVAYDQVQAQIDAAERERQATAEEDTPSPAPKTETEWPETTAFKRDNATWFSVDPILTRAMIDAHVAVLSRNPNIGRAEGFAEARAMVVDAFPHRFQNEDIPPVDDEPPAREAPRRRPAASVLPPSGGVRRPSVGADPFARIPDEREREDARTAFKGVGKYDPDTTAAEYVQLYLGEADILSIRAARKKS